MSGGRARVLMLRWRGCRRPWCMCSNAASLSPHVALLRPCAPRLSCAACSHCVALREWFDYRGHVCMVSMHAVQHACNGLRAQRPVHALRRNAHAASSGMGSNACGWAVRVWHA